MDTRRLSRTAAATGLVAGPLIFAISTAIDPAWADGTAAHLAEVGNDTGAYAAAGILMTVGALVFLAGTVGLARLLRGRRVGVGLVGAILLTLGLVGMAAGAAFNGMEIAMAEAGDRAAAVALSKDLEESALLNGYWMGFFFVGIVLGTILLTIALVRRPIVPRWAPGFLLVAVVVGFLGESQVVSAATFVLLAAGFAPLAQRMWRLSDDEWGQWSPLADAEPAARTAEPAFAPPTAVAR